MYEGRESIIHLWVSSLQLSPTGLRDLLTRTIRHIHFLVAIPAQSTQSLRQDGMREVVAGIHPIRIHGAKVLNLKLDQ